MRAGEAVVIAWGAGLTSAQSGNRDLRMLGSACFLFFPFLASGWNLGLSVGLPSSWKPLQKLSHRYTQKRVS